MGLTTTTIDRGAFDAAILRLQPGLMRQALGLTRDKGDARELVQDAFERGLREWTRFTPGTNARAWMSAILSRLFIDRWRRRKRAPHFVDIDGTDLVAPTPGAPERWAGELESDGGMAAPWEGVTAADLTEAIAGLPAKLRVVFELSAGDRRSYLEIAGIVGIPVNTVGTRLLRARRRLRAILERRMKARARGSRPTLALPPSPLRRAREMKIMMPLRAV